MAGSWDPTSLPTLPGLYANMVEAADLAVTGGSRGTVAIPLLNNTGTAQEGNVYTVSKVTEAEELFGAANIQSIKFALQGGAKDVLVYVMPDTPEETDYEAMRLVLDTRDFNVFVFDGEYNATEQTNTKAWVARNRDEGKHFMVVIGGNATTDANPSEGNTRSSTLADDYIVNLITGVTINENDYNSSQFAPYVAGLIAGTAINQSTTYAQVYVDDVTKRLTKTEQSDALDSGSFVLVHDGRKVKVLQGITTTKEKIRSIRARQAVLMDLATTANDAYIGKIDNNEDGQFALISAVKAYLESLEASNVLTDPTVGLDPNYESVGDKVFLLISYVEVDSMERIFLTINLN